MKITLYICVLGIALLCLGGCNKKDQEAAVKAAKDQQAKEELKKEYYKQQKQSLIEAGKNIQNGNLLEAQKKRRDMIMKNIK